MAKFRIALCFYLLILLRAGFVQSHKTGVKKLFVFGDSYADTGNHPKSTTSSWKQPYGVTFSGKPTGRWSDGRVMSDFFASLVGMRSPIPYQWRKLSQKRLKEGMNFAYGGTGVFDTWSTAPNLTTQIDLFENLIAEGTYTRLDVSSSMALVSVAGNDYTNYQARNGTIEKVKPFMVSLINQLALDIKRLQAIGVRKILVTALPPLGCVPAATVVSSYRKCNDTLNKLAGFHNLLLNKAILEINNGATKSQRVATLDLYNAFMSSISSKKIPGFETMKPCCTGKSSEYFCGSVDVSGVKKYSLCANPSLSFFWDSSHPSQRGWASISTYLQSTLQQLH